VTASEPPPCPPSHPDAEDGASSLALAGTAIDVVLRVGLVALLIAWCLWIAQPFILPLLWGAIIAVALDPLHERLSQRLGGRPGLAGAVLTVAGLLLMVGPLAVLGVALGGTVRTLAASALRGELDIPPPPEGLASIPLIGQTLTEYWQLASTNLEELLVQIEPQIRQAGAWLLGFAGGLGLGFLSGLFALVVAGVLLAWRGRIVPTVHRLAVRLAGARGEPLLLLGEETVQAVARGIVGTAFVQALFATIGFMVAGVPGGPFWGFVVFLFGLIQIGALPVMIPVVIWAFMTMSALPLVLFLVWTVLVSLIDNVLRPLWIGSGARVPLLVLLIGVIGGLLAHGLIGLFVGPVVVALGYTLLTAWLARAT
jgi:predicted PurR-regulated permease PerM